MINHTLLALPNIISPFFVVVDQAFWELITSSGYYLSYFSPPSVFVALMLFWLFSWGAVYFPETWMEYRLYLAARLREDHIAVNIKGSKTNK